MTRDDLIEATREIYQNRTVVQFKASPAMWTWMRSNATGDQDDHRLTIWGVPVFLDEMMPDKMLIALDREGNVIKAIVA